MLYKPKKKSVCYLKLLLNNNIIIESHDNGSDKKYCFDFCSLFGTQMK